MIASALAYVPLAIAFTPWEWSQFGPFALQLCRPLHYAVYFFAGLGVGAYSLENGLLARDGVLARRWAVWLAAAFATFVLWITPTALIVDDRDAAPLGLQFMPISASSCAARAAAFSSWRYSLSFATTCSRMLDSLSHNAYGMYLIHYVFVVWLQYSLLEAPLFAFAKAGIVFGGTLLLSWATTAALLFLPLGARLLGTERRALAEAP